MSQRSLESSSNAYDKHLLSKIGRPTSPPRLSTTGLEPDPFSPTTRSPLQHATNLGSSGGRDSSFDVGLGWGSTLPSGPISPGRPSLHDYMNWRSSSIDSSAPSSAIDPDQYTHLRGVNHHRGSGSGSTINFDDASSVASRSARGSYDQSYSNDPDDMDFPVEETGGMRQLSIGDRATAIADRHSPDSKFGTKRKAPSSPSRKEARDDKYLSQYGSNTDIFPRRSSGPLAPNVRFTPHGSVSSASSASIRNGSYASTGGLSVGSSMTSMSTQDRISPGGVSPLSPDMSVSAGAGAGVGVGVGAGSGSGTGVGGGGQSQDSPYVTPGSLNPSPRGSLSTATSSTSTSRTQPPHLQRQYTDSAKPSLASRKMSVQGAVQNTRSPAASKLQGMYICDCCPKKPKRFESQEELL